MFQTLPAYKEALQYVELFHPSIASVCLMKHLLEDFQVTCVNERKRWVALLRWFIGITTKQNNTVSSWLTMFDFYFFQKSSPVQGNVICSGFAWRKWVLNVTNGVGWGTNSIHHWTLFIIQLYSSSNSIHHRKLSPHSGKLCDFPVVFCNVLL